MRIGLRQALEEAGFKPFVLSKAEAQLRQRMHLGPEESLALGEALDGAVDVPTNLSDGEKGLFRELAAMRDGKP